jgi:hypothetical protein
VNQWTLLVGTLPLVFTVASGTATGLPVGAAQREELLLTAAQSLFAVAVLVNLEISVREAAALSGLFLTQFAIAALVPGSTELVVLGIAYLALAAVLLLRGRRRIGPLLRDGLLTPYPQLQDRRAGPRAGGHRAPPGRERPEASPLIPPDRGRVGAQPARRVVGPAGAHGAGEPAPRLRQRDGSVRAAAVWTTPGEVAAVVTAPRLADRTVSAYLANTPQAMADDAGR